jgi:inosine-uridine nucleoside N-ribohydrolase
MIDQVSKSQSPSAQYIAKWADEEYLWDELAALAWIDPSLITRQEPVYMDIDISHTAAYGNTLVWTEGNQPGLGERQVVLQTDLDLPRFNRMVIDLFSR